MTCAAVMEEASPFLDGELGDERRDAVEAHLSSCAGCAQEVASLRRLDGVLAGVSEPAVSRTRSRPAWALAACLLLALTGTWLVLPAPSPYTVQMSQRAYQVAVEGGTLLSVDVYDSREHPIRFEDGGIR